MTGAGGGHRRTAAEGWCCTHLRAGLDLADEEVDADVGDAVEERLGLGGVLEEPRLALLERLRAAALDHVREERPGRAAEADEGHLARERGARARDRGVDVPELLVDVDVLGEALDVRGRDERVGEVRARVHLHLHAHRLRDDEDVGEDDRGVDEPGEPPDRLEGDLHRELGRAADLEEAVFCAHREELCVRSCAV